MPKKNMQLVMTELLEIMKDEASDADSIGFMARALVQATLPHSRLKDENGKELLYFERKNGDLTLAIMGSKEYGLPFGSIPRILLAWMTTEAVRTKSREIVLGDNLSSFMSEIGLTGTGGRNGSITRLRNQLFRLFNAHISCTYEDKSRGVGKNFNLASSYEIVWWDNNLPVAVGNKKHNESTVVLGSEFFEEITTNPVPLDLRAIKFLKNSAMALDIYSWLTYRMFSLKKATTINWESLELQFGADYARTRQFKESFLEQLEKVLLVYPDARVEECDRGLLLKPSPTHIRHIKN